MTLKIGIIGTRGIPNRYGGFEQLAQYLAVGLVQKGHEVVVYNGHDHVWQAKNYEGVQLVHCRNPEKAFGTAGQFVYDFNCVMDARKRHFDVLLFLGYTSSSVWGRLYPTNTIIVTNMDGMEWQRSKYSAATQRFLRYAEKLAVKHSDYLIADSVAVQQYLYNKYQVNSTHIAYGAEIFTEGDDALLRKYGLQAKEYYMLMARMEPENNISMVLEGFTASDTTHPLLIIGNAKNRYGQQLQQQFKKDKRIIFAGAVYDTAQLHTLKHNALLYFHGHSVGGTNPSLLEAMASRVAIAAHDNVFNRAVLQEDAFYFDKPETVTKLLSTIQPATEIADMVQRNVVKVQQQYNWPLIIDQYEQLLLTCCQSILA